MNEELLQILQIAFLFLGLVFGIQTDSPEELMLLVLAGLSAMEEPVRDELAQTSMSIALGLLSGEITQELIPLYVQLCRLKYGIGTPMSARLGGILRYINKLNNR